MLEYTCPYCEKTVLIGDDEREKQVKCPHCDMLGVAYGVNIRSTDAPDVPDGHVPERHRPRRKKPKPSKPRRETGRTTPPPVPPAVPDASHAPKRTVPPSFQGRSGQDAPDLGPDQQLRSSVRKMLGNRSGEQARQLATFAVVSGAAAVFLSFTPLAGHCCFFLPGVLAVLAFLFSGKARGMVRQGAVAESESVDRLAGIAIVLAVIAVVLTGLVLIAKLS